MLFSAGNVIRAVSQTTASTVGVSAFWNVRDRPRDQGRQGMESGGVPLLIREGSGKEHSPYNKFLYL